MADDPLPQYFDDIREPERYFGELIREEKRWVIKAEPQVTHLKSVHVERDLARLKDDFKLPAERP